MPDMGSITIGRKAAEDIRDRQVVVSIDGRTVASLLFGESITLPVEAGRHRLKVHNTLVWKTAEFDVTPGNEVRFTAVNRAGFGTYAMLSLLGVGPLYVSLRRDA